MRRLIINADDLGITEGVNRAILEASQQGVVTSATLMANGLALQDAVVRLNSLPERSRLSVGCHLSLVDGVPLSAPENVRTLLDGGREFGRTVGKFGLAAMRRKFSSAEIEREASAQFQALTDSGIKISHFDAHKHAHMFPEVLEPALKAAAGCGIRAVRNPFESTHPLPFSTLLQYPKLLKRYLQVKLLNTMQAKWKSLVQRFGFATPDGSLGVIVTGNIDRTLLRALLEHMPEGTWELVCHPGYNDAALGKVRTRLRQSREQEQALLTSPETQEFLDKLGIELISYHQL